MKMKDNEMFIIYDDNKLSFCKVMFHENELIGDIKRCCTECVFSKYRQNPVTNYCGNAIERNFGIDQLCITASDFSLTPIVTINE